MTEVAWSPQLSAHGALAQSLRAARSVWPTVNLSEDRFLRHLGGCLPPSGDLLELHVEDLYLACACLHGDESAIRIFEEQYFGEIEFAFRRTHDCRLSAEDVRQRLFAKLFAGNAPKIGSYAGRASLRTWLQAVIGRTLVDCARERSPEEPVAEELFMDLAAAEDGPDLQLLKGEYREALRGAFAEAANRLTSREKNVLRYGLSEHLTIDEIGAIYGVHRVTASRWLQSARSAFAAHVRAILVERLRISETELHSLLRLAISQIDMSLSRVFAQTGEHRRD